MIVSRRALQAASAIAKVEKNSPIAGNVCIECTGEVIALNRNVLFIVEPVSKEMKGKIPLKEVGFQKRIVLPLATVETICKAVPRDTMFKGLLEYVNIECKDGLAIVVTLTDGKKQHSINCSRSGIEWVNWRKTFQDFKTEEMFGHRVVWNRKRLASAVEAVEIACQYDGEFSPVFIHTGTKRTILRSINELTGQRIVCIFSESECQWLEENEWELSLKSEKKKLKLVLK
jgi:hypothetical protein